jgi:hypothetical protein
MLSKDDTQKLCASAGGRLCTAAEIQGLQGRKLGCSLDAYAVWSSEDRPVGLKFARCCGDYEMSVECAAYVAGPRVSFCTNQRVLWDCMFKGSGTSQQIDKGFGRLLDSFRKRCASGEFGSSCQGALMRPWYFREKCLWCPKLSSSDNDGDCRPGSDYGICPFAPDSAKRLFGVNLVAVCGNAAACGLRRMFPDITLPIACT